MKGKRLITELCDEEGEEKLVEEKRRRVEGMNSIERDTVG